MNRLAAVSLALLICAPAAAQSGQADLAIRILLPLMEGGVPAPAFAGQPYTFTVKVTNNGPSEAANVSWISNLPDGVTFHSAAGGFCVSDGQTVQCSLDTLGVGEAAQIQVTVDVGGATPQGAVFVDATVTSSTADPDTGNNTATAGIEVIHTWDVAVRSDSSYMIVAGMPATFTVTLTSLGPADSSPLSFTDDLPGGTTFLAWRQISGPGFACTTPGAGSGGSVDCSVDGSLDKAVFEIDVMVPASFPNWSVIHNHVSLHADDNNSLNNSDGPSTIVLADAVLSVGVSGPATVAPGTSATYVMTMTNAGSSPTLTLSFEDRLQPGAQGSHVTLSNARQVSGPAFDCVVQFSNPLLDICNAAEFPAAATATFELTYAFDAGTPMGTVFTNEATGFRMDGRAGPGLTAAKVTTTIAPASSPQITFHADPSAIPAGGSSTLTWQVSNATAVSIDDGIGLQPVSGSLLVTPLETTTYTLTANGDGGSASSQATVTVVPPPVVISFTATPDPVISGKTVRLHWTTANVTVVSIEGLGLQAPNGEVEVHPAVTTTYILTASGIGGSSVREVKVTVLPSKRRAVSH